MVYGKRNPVKLKKLNSLAESLGIPIVKPKPVFVDLGFSSKSSSKVNVDEILAANRLLAEERNKLNKTKRQRKKK